MENKESENYILSEEFEAHLKFRRLRNTVTDSI